MPRPRKRRRVLGEPGFCYFKPQGVPLAGLEETILTVEEYEALRLSDFQEISQQEASKKMGISQPTFHRILNSARKKLSDAIINGKAIKIAGGHYEIR
ncbi:MAG: DUF134 domain-containing protein [Candidatus Altiarchaeota archaeon]|nr:DUF134 domain-containing protein [Candidatus Altiarchaeota archaeon]